MGDEIKPSVIKKTQDTLGKFVKRPPLTEKLLRKPPFRFLHDIMTTVIRETKFLDGLFNEVEMNSENVKDKESKIAFLQKVIDVVNLACGISLTVRPTKIVAGYEPDKTNELLQAIGKAIEKKVDSSAAVQRVLSKSNGNTGSNNLNKSQTKKEEPSKAKRSTGTIKKVPKDQLGSTQNLAKSVPKVEEKDKRSTVASKGSKDKRIKKSDEKPPISTRNAKESKLRSQLTKEKRKLSDTVIHEGSSKKGDNEGKGMTEEGNERAEMDAQARDLNIRRRSDAKVEESGRKGSVIEEEGIDRTARRNTLELGEEVEDAFPSLEPPVSERETGQRGDSAKNIIENIPKVEDNNKPGSSKKKNSMSTGPSEDTKTNVNSGQRMAISTPVLRPASVMATASSRPRSSRPHAPRLRSALGGMILASDQDRIADKTGKGIMVEQPTEGQSGGGDNNTDDVDEKEFLVEEARPLSPSLPPKEVKQLIGEGSEMLSLDGEKQQGVLVAKILETKKELEAGVEERENAEGDEHGHIKRVEIEYEEDEKRRRRRGVDEIENLQSLVQSIARSAHPLGSLLGMVQGNVEAMRTETTKWRNECENLLKQLREEEKNMELELEPLRSVLSEVEQRVIEEREALSAAKVRVLKAEERIQVMLDPQGNGAAQGIPTSYRVS